jgi:penicillin-binding protein 2
MKFDERKYVLIATVIFICVVFILRLFWVQVVDAHWKAEAANISERKITVFPSRGLIRDRHGNLLLANTPVYDIMVVPKDVQPFDTAAFSALIGVTTEETARRLREAMHYSPFKPSVFEKQITADQYATIAVHLHRYPGFFGQSRTLRTYPQRIAAHLLGYLSEVDARKVEEDPYYKPGDVIGVGGLEQYYEKELRGRRGVKYVVVDVHNKIQGPFKNGQYDTLAYEGRDLFTGIDVRMQALGEKLMQHKKGSIVAIEPKSGELLCLVTSPGYDPELLVGRIRNSNYGILQNDSLKPLFDRALQAQYPPGSIYKIVQALIGLQEGVIVPQTGFPCNKDLVGCHNHPTAFDVEHAIQYSCNPYFYQVFKRIVEQGKDPNRFKDAALGLAEWREYMMSFGLGQRPPIDLPSAKGGNIPSVGYYDRVYGENAWAFSTIYSLAIGQGECSWCPRKWPISQPSSPTKAGTTIPTSCAPSGRRTVWSSMVKSTSPGSTPNGSRWWMRPCAAWCRRKAERHDGHASRESRCAARPAPPRIPTGRITRCSSPMRPWRIRRSRWPCMWRTAAWAEHGLRPLPAC